MSAGADLDFLRYKARPRGLERLYRVCEIRHVYRDMVKTLTAFFDELGNHRVRSRRFQQLDAALPQRNHRHLDLLMRHRFLAHHFQPELFVELARLRQRLYRDPEMVNSVHENGSWLLAFSSWSLDQS